MQKMGIVLAVILMAALIVCGCGTTGLNQVTTNTTGLQPISEDAPIVIPENTQTTEVNSKWKEATHVSITDVAATTWGISAARVTNMANASKMPDTYQSGLDNAFNQQWSHAYLWCSLGFWIWGDADDDYYDNINQDGGEIESPEGYNGKSAKYYYERSDQYNGDWYVGYACHYIEDVCLVLHSSDPTLNMLTQHFNFEAWIANNWTSGHNFKSTIVNDGYYYTVTDLKAAIRNASKGSSYWTSTLGKTVWDNYVSSGYPTGTGTGNSTLVSNTRTMLIRAVRYSRGTIKYALDTWSQWTNRY